MYFKVQPEGFHVDGSGKSVDDIKITCVLADLAAADQATFAEHLTYRDGAVLFVVNFQARRLAAEGTSRRWVEVNVGSGVVATGPALEMTVRELLASAYLRPLRDAERRLQRLQKQLVSQDLLIIDELGFVPLSKTGAELLFEVISQRYERDSIIITSNLPFDEWTEIFGADRLTGAIMDCLTHHVNILEMNGESFRLKHSREHQKIGPTK